MWALFKEKNEINEKNVIGFMSFIVMTLFAIADLMTSLLADKDLVINEVVYNSFVFCDLFHALWFQAFDVVLIFY